MDLYTEMREKRLASLWLSAVMVVMVMFLVTTGPAPAGAADFFQAQPGAIDAQQQGGDQGFEQSASPAGGIDQMGADRDIGEGESPEYEQADQGADQYGEQPQDLGDIPDAEDMTFFDPETIPDSVFPADADWAFNVPINVSNLPPQVEKLGITCETLYWYAGGEIKDNRWSAAGQERNRADCGYAKRRIDIDDGAYSGNIVIGVQMTGGASNDIEHRYWEAREYECKMYLVGDPPGDDNRWLIPQTSPISPFWLRADANQAFRWWTGRQPIPVAAKPNPPWADADGDAAGAIQDAAEGAAGMAGQAGGEADGAEGVPAEGMQQNLQNLN